MPINVFHGHGQLAYAPKIIEEDGSQTVKNKLIVRRNYKINGDYEFDYIPIVLRGESARFVTKYVNRLDYIYVLGRLKTEDKSFWVEVREVDFDYQHRTIQGKCNTSR